MNLSRWLFRLLLGRRWPRIDGDLVVPGLAAEIRIDRDAWGIPHITPPTISTPSLAVGFCHGQDRSFQLELLLRVGRGTLAEMGGGRGAAHRPPVAAHRLFIARRNSSGRCSTPTFGTCSRRTRAASTPGARSACRARPTSSSLLRSRPTPWTPLDSLGAFKLISFTLPATGTWNWPGCRMLDRRRPRRTGGARSGVSRLAAGYRAAAGRRPPVLRPARGGCRRVHELWCAPAAAPTTGRSPPAVLRRAGRSSPTIRTSIRACRSTGISPTLRTPEWADCRGALSSAARSAAGHNGFAAWGVTAGLVDNTDLFLEHIGPDGRSVRARRTTTFPARCATRSSMSAAAPASRSDVLIDAARTDHQSGVRTASAEALSLRAVWLDPLPMRGLLDLHRVRGFDELPQALAEHWPATSQNLVYADVTGHNRLAAIRTAPRRRTGWGTAAAAGLGPTMPAGKRSRCRSRRCRIASIRRDGFLATANNQPLPGDEGPFLAVDWIDGYRRRASAGLLRAEAIGTWPRRMALQMDQRSLPGRRCATIVLSLQTGDAAARARLSVAARLGRPR